MKIKIIKKAYRVWVHSQIGDYPVFSPDQLEPVYANSTGEAKGKCEYWYGEKNEFGEKYLEYMKNTCGLFPVC